MPPKAAAKVAAPAARLQISDSSLVYLAEDAVEGFQDRLDQCVDWNIRGTAIRHHLELCRREDIPTLKFTDALNNKIKNSILHGFLDEHSTLTLQEHWETLLPMAIWDNENCGVEEAKTCFRSVNNITDNLLHLIKDAVKANNRQVLKKHLKTVHVLRVNDIQMTDLDRGVKKYPKLVTLNLCGNYISNVDGEMLAKGIRLLEMQANRIATLENVRELPQDLLYLGLAKNMLTTDLSDNDIYDLEPLLEQLALLPNLTGLQLAGNPCSVCCAYARTTLTKLPRLRWLDNRQVLPTDRADENFEPHPDDLRSAYFVFTVIRIMSAPIPPKPDKGATGTFHVSLELPLFDSVRRNFLMFRRYESLTELLPSPEDDFYESIPSSVISSKEKSGIFEGEAMSEETDIFARLEAKSSRIIEHFTLFESNKVPWNKIMNFQEPTIRIFCPDLTALRDTFRSNITIKLIYSLNTPTKKPDKKSAMAIKQPPADQQVTIATIKCSLQTLDWSQVAQHFYWDDSLNTKEAMHWGDGDLSVIQYQLTPLKPTKGKEDAKEVAKQSIPENLTCHFGFGIETLR
ncbi:uncharacterized protein LOC126381994 isoform X2 [Pectinophora gossypiella]|uniref:uncharacterized protein LOC126381994 isoform X2 n=1 Tax=Pectinophora gossypiella TaxID=13191 RepID=UPI00214E7534|nr:uncharacterized protein LOC126381994 isoform X2 [Pectinophora gossypiella]